MTTEIAVSNQLGIALAADSAVTITSGGHVKVFDTADKLFELSATYPVAVMINGNMDCLGTPWEILVKQFRAVEGNKARGSVEKWARDFLNFIESHNPNAEERENGYIDRAVESEIDEIQRLVRQVVQRYIFEASRGSNLLKRGNLNIAQVLAFAIDIRKGAVEESPRAETLKEVTPDAIREKYSPRINTMLDKKFTGQKLTDSERTSLLEVVVESLLRSVGTDATTGIVVAGYGADDDFPAVFSAEIDGRVAGKLKVFNEKFSAIVDCEDGGMVTTFAQTDVTERLLRGVDARFVERTAGFIQKAVSDAMEKTFESIKGRKLGKKAAREREALISDMADAAKNEFENKAAEAIKNQFARQFDSMIAMMPKQELIELAEALVSITAIERKATVDEGTVGGPVDVALITKHEGFVWIKRKHHFPRDLNPRYFWRHYGATPKGSS